ncbi:MAG: STAS domain-containing protein [Paracoccaceae bacterium]|nr:STAS domain-containing protein [Paracoccaceae bacterium]
MAKDVWHDLTGDPRLGGDAVSARFELPEKLDTAAVPDLIAALRAHQGSNLVLDAGGLTQIGGLAVQTMIVAANDWQDGGHILTLEGVSDDVRSQLQLLGTSPEVLTEGDIR